MRPSPPTLFSAMQVDFASAEGAKHAPSMYNHLTSALEKASEIRQDLELAAWHAQVEVIVRRWHSFVERRLQSVIAGSRHDYVELRALVSSLHLFNDPLLGTDSSSFVSAGSDELLMLLGKPIEKISPQEMLAISSQLELLLSGLGRARNAP